MTNKPMLSVELRALLDRLLSHDFAEECQECGIGYSDAWGELRALLDKPASPQAWERDMDYRPEELGSPETEPACWTCNDTNMVDDGDLTHSAGGILYECGPIKCVKDCPDCKPAAQHQGEPVAWAIQWGSVIPGCRGHREVVLKHPGALDAVITPLFAEQPAPVAVVMPERENENGLENEQSEQAIGYNRALADVARLNGVKP